MLFQWTKKLTRERRDFVPEVLRGTSQSFPTELSNEEEEEKGNQQKCGGGGGEKQQK